MPLVAADLIVVPITRSLTKIAGTTVSNINQDRGKDHEDWLEVKRKYRKSPNNKIINAYKDINTKFSILVKEYPSKKLAHENEKKMSINVCDHYKKTLFLVSVRNPC